MNVEWADIAFVPEPDTAAEAAAAWAWLVAEPWRPLLCSMIGDIFLEKEAGGVFWLECGTGSVEQIAVDAAEFESLLRSNPDKVEEWFLPGLVEDLHKAGKRPEPGQCYAFVILPAFKEGKFEADNMCVVPVREQLAGTAALLKQLRDVPEGGRVQIKIVD
jgi:hypothetical protein